MDHLIPVEGKWMRVSDADIESLYATGNKEDAANADYLGYLILEFQKNPLSMALPHGLPWSKEERIFADGRLIIPASAYPKAWKNDGIAFLNDWDNGFVIMLAPNQVGKSYISAVKTALAILPCDPKWPIFAKHGVKCPEWTGPKKWIVASYSWDNVRTMFETIQQVFPRNELRDFSPRWGTLPGETGKQRQLTFRDGRGKEVEFACGTVIKFLSYIQLQCFWEGFPSHGLTADEQIPFEKWIGWERSTRTKGKCPSIHAFTGHVVEDRPDTGAGGWFKQEVWDQQEAHGRTVGRYHIQIENVPDAIISAENKQQAWKMWADPNVKRTPKQERAAVARYWGGWEEGGGLLFDEFDRSVHVINPLWEDDKVPQDWTKWRVIDYGDNGVTCVSWWATGPKGYSVCYRLLYERGLLVAQTSKLMIEMSHNEQVKVGTEEDDVTGSVYNLYEEKQNGEQFYATLLDCRSASQDKQGPNLIQLFARFGIDCREACGQRNEIQIPRLKEFLRIDWDKDHPYKPGKKGASRLYFFDGRTDTAVLEIERCNRDNEFDGRINKKDAHHFIDTAKYWASDSPAYMGDEWDKDKHTPDELPPRRTPFTGY